jgi:SHS2 domain-containing protein
MKKYEYFEHTADVKFKAYGKNLEESFGNAALATFHVMVDPETIKPLVRKSFGVKGHDLKALLYNFLEELLFYLDSEHFILSKVEKIKIDRMGDSYVLQALVLGDKVKDEYDVSGDVKAVTYNDMEIHETSTGCSVQVVLDI